MAPEPVPAALVSVARRNRRRYGGYLVHIGVAVALLGVAASSAFNTQRDVRLGPGEAASVAGYDVRYVRPTSDLSNEKHRASAPCSRCARTGSASRLLRPSRNYFPAAGRIDGPAGALLPRRVHQRGGSATAGSRRDVWTALQPDLRVLNAADPRGQPAGYAMLPPEAQARDDRGPFRALCAARAARHVPADREPDGDVDLDRRADRARRAGSIALWPSPLSARRRVSSLRAARLGRELSRA